MKALGLLPRAFSLVSAVRGRQVAVHRALSSTLLGTTWQRDSRAPGAIPAFYLLAQRLPRFSAAPMCRDERLPGGVDITCLAQLCPLSWSCCTTAIHYTQALLSMELASVIF